MSGKKSEKEPTGPSNLELFLVEHPELRGIHDEHLGRLSQAKATELNALADLRAKKKTELSALGGIILISGIVTVLGLLEEPLDTIPFVGDAVALWTEKTVENWLASRYLKPDFDNKKLTAAEMELYKREPYKLLKQRTANENIINTIGIVGDVVGFIPGEMLPVNPALLDGLEGIAALVLAGKKQWDKGEIEAQMTQIIKSLDPQQQKAFDTLAQGEGQNLRRPVERLFGNGQLATAGGMA